MKKKSTTILAAALLMLGMTNAQTSPIACFAFNKSTQDAVSGRTANTAQTTYVLGKNGGNDSAISFSGTASSYVQLPTKNLQPAKLSVSCWVKAANVTTTQYVLFQKNSASSSFEGYVLVIDAGVFRFVKNNGGSGSSSSTSSSTITANTWYQVGMVFTGDSIKIYVNGALASASVSNFGIDYDASSGMVIGGSGQSFNLPFTGAIDNLKMYNKEISAAEMMTLYSTNPLCGPMPKDEGEFYLACNASLDDASFNDHMVTGTNVAYGTDIAGVATQALNLDGTGYLTMPSGFISSSARQISISLWFNTTETSRPNGLAYGGTVAHSGTPTNYTPFMWLDSNGYLCGFMYDNTVSSPKSTMALNDGKWHHVAYQLVVNPTTFALTQSLWVDGKMDATKSGTVGGGGPQFTYFYIGTCNARGINGNMPDVWFNFKGRLDEIRVNFVYEPDYMLKNFDMAITKNPNNWSMLTGQTFTLETDHTDFNNGTTYSYKWYKDGAAISGATSKTYTKVATAADAGQYYCEVTNNTSAPWTISSTTATVSISTGVSNISHPTTSITLFPNPATSQLNVSQSCSISIYDLSGKLVLQEKLNGNAVEVGHLSRGIYMARITTNGTENMQKVVLR